jgi:hypothetical protein
MISFQSIEPVVYLEVMQVSRPNKSQPDAVDQMQCPFCGQTNQCAMAMSGDDKTRDPCWCATVQFSQDLLNQLPEHAKNTVCICATCAAESRPQGEIHDNATWHNELETMAWTHQLTDQELLELDAATKNACERKLLPATFTRKDFALPTLGPRLAGIVDSVENGVGFAVVKGVPVHQYDEHALQVLYWGLGCYLGKPISQNSRGERLAVVSDRGNSYDDRNTRGFASSAELVPHVDTSDMTALLCVQTAKQGGESRVVSASWVYNTILSEHPEYLDPLFGGFHNDLRGEGPTTSIDELTNQPIPVFSYYANRLSCSFNSRMIDNGFVKSGVEPTPLARAALDFMREVTLRETTGIRFFMQPGDIQLVSNHSVFHSRTQFKDYAELDKRRCLYRLWLNLHNGRALAPRFADRYNTGPRGGVAVGTGARYEF